MLHCYYHYVHECLSDDVFDLSATKELCYLKRSFVSVADVTSVPQTGQGPFPPAV
jgi:hypothetical protein